jgi:hypothetical protein
MCRKSFPALLVALLILFWACAVRGGFDPTRDPALVGWWAFDEGKGTVAADGSPNGNNGTINGGAIWVPGVYGSALQFNGTNAYVGTGKSLLNGLTGFTMAGWISAGSTGVYASLFGQNDLIELGFTTENGGQVGTWMAGNNWAFIGANWGLPYPSWHHIALAGDADRIALTSMARRWPRRENGMTSGTSSYCSPSAATSSTRPADWFPRRDRDVWLFRRRDGRGDPHVEKGPGGPGRATAPIPADEAEDVPRDVTLSWTAGEYAATHDVYFGTSVDDVNAAGKGVPSDILVSGGQTTTAYQPGELLDYGRTYFWRVDEVNAAPDDAIYKGKVWSFTTEPYGYPVKPAAAKASSSQFGAGPQNTINGSGLSATDTHSTDMATMWMTNGPQPHWIEYDSTRSIGCMSCGCGTPTSRSSRSSVLGPGMSRSVLHRRRRLDGPGESPRVRTGARLGVVHRQHCRRVRRGGREVRQADGHQGLGQPDATDRPERGPLPSTSRSRPASRNRAMRRRTWMSKRP